MSAATLRPGTDGIRPLDVIVSCVVLFALAVAQPLLDLLGRNAEFFLARAAPPIDIVAVALLVTIVLPLLIALLIIAVRKVHEPTGRILHGVVLATLGGVLALQIIGLTPLAGLLAWVEIAMAVAAGALLAVAYYRYESLRSAGRFAAIAPLVVLGLFLFTSSASQLVFTAPAVAQPAQITVNNPAPVVMVVFDEFPVASLMDGDGNLQEHVYPNFARLAEDGTWFRNATTVQQQTENSLPAMLSGKNPPDDKLPTAADHPFTLFTLLADSYDLQVQESVTGLCPEYACENASRPERPAGQRWGTLLDDLRIVAGHLFLPNDLTDDLPSIDASWSNFSGGEDGEDYDIISRFQVLTYDEDRRSPIAQFLEDIAEPANGEPRLTFLHALVPHVPWDYLASGQTYPSPSVAPGSKSPGWGDDVWLVDQAYQQHLVQVQYVDRVVGAMIDRLEEADLYDDALVIVVADHGVTVRPNIHHRRVADEETIGDVAAVPLFIKRPHQEAGGIDDYRAETVDVLPTIAAVLEIAMPWGTDGTSLFADDRPERTESTIDGSKGTIVFGTDGSEARAVAARKIDHFGTDGPFGLAPPGHADLLGLEVDELDVHPTEGVTVTIRNVAAFDAVDKAGPSLPAWVSGTIVVPETQQPEMIIAIAVNGEIAAVTRSTEDEDGKIDYGAMIPPDSLIDGPNEITLFIVQGTGDGRTLLDLQV